MYPYAGGDYVYVREAFHPAAGFLVGWLSFFAIYAGTIATLAAGFAASLGPFVPLGEREQLAVAIAITLAVSAVNYVGVRWGARANNLTAMLKIGALLALGLTGPLLGKGNPGNLWAPVEGASGLTLSAFGLARFSSAISAGTPPSTSPARSASRAATCRARSSPAWPSASSCT